MLFAACVLLVASAPDTSFVARVADATNPTRADARFAAGWLAADKRPLLELTSTTRPRPALPAGPHVVLANGDRIPGTLAAADELGVTVKTNLYAWRIPLAQVRVAWLSAPAAETPDGIDRYAWLAPNRTRDTLLLRNGDIRSGDLARLSDDARQLMWTPADSPATNFDANRVAALATNPNLVSNRKLKGSFARAVLTNGARVTLLSAESDGIRLRGTTAFGAKFDLALENLVALQVFQAQATYLSSLTPAKLESTAYADLAWPMQLDRSARNQPLRLRTARGVETFDNGLGTHPRTRVSFDLAGKHRTLEALVGLDAVTGKQGAARVTVLVDDQDRTPDALRNLTSAAEAFSLRIDVAGAKRLTLVVDFAPAGDAHADVNWANARLIDEK